MHLEESGNVTTLESLRSYVRNNTLTLYQDYYNAKKQKIRHLALPEIDTDATNKSYLDSALRDLRDEIETRTLSIIRADVEGLMKNVALLQVNNEELSKRIGKIKENIDTSLLTIKNTNEELSGIRETIALNKNYVEQTLRDLRNEIKKHMKPTQKEKQRPPHNQKEKDKNVNSSQKQTRPTPNLQEEEARLREIYDILDKDKKTSHNHKSSEKGE